MEIKTERLLLREFNDDDWADVLSYQKNPLYHRYYEWTDRTPEAAKDFVRIFIAQQREEPRTKFQLAITLPSTGELIGNCGLRMASADAREGDIGYELSPIHWGHGYATEAAKSMLDLGFRQFGLHRISSWCVADNAASARVLENLGMKLEGRLRDKDYFKGRWWDTLLFAILDDEWATWETNFSHQQ